MTDMQTLREQPFAYHSTKDKKILITWLGKQVMIIKGKDSEKLLAKLQGADEQAVQLALAKVTGNFKRGNEKGR